MERKGPTERKSGENGLKTCVSVKRVNLHILFIQRDIENWFISGWKKNGGRNWARTNDLYDVNVAL